jgi:hypothetical protein
MKPLHVEFAQHRAGRTSSVLWIMLTVALVAVAAGLVLGNTFTSQAQARVRQAGNLLAQHASLSEAIQHQDEVPMAVVESANEAIYKLNYPVIELLSQLEHHAKPEVQVASVEIGPIRTSLRVVVQAGSVTQVLDYIDEIKKEPGFRNVALTHQEVGTGADAGKSRFTLEVAQGDGAARARGGDGGGDAPKGAER